LLAGDSILNSNIDKQEMRSYLLGALDSDLRMQLEQRILSEPETYDELLLIEQELIDQYLAGGLSKNEQRQFENNFLITAERQKNLRFGRLLRRYVNAHPVLVPGETPRVAVRQTERAPAPKSFPFSLPSFGRRPWGFAAALVVFVGLIAFAWFISRRPSERLAQKRTVPEVGVTLAPGSVRSEGGAMPRVKVPPKGYDLKLELEVTNLSFQNYKSELFRENEPVQTTDDLKVETKREQHVVPFTIRGEMLSPGDYQVRLSGVLESGADEFIDNYSFRVIE
jgi:hypothetical protein